MDRIVIVEDNRIVLEGLVKNIPWAQHGFEVAGAYDNGEDALNAVLASPPDLVLTDIIMPVMDGLELTRKVREAHPEIRVLMLSAYNEFEYAKEALSLGASDYIMKPFLTDTLISACEKARESKHHDDELRAVLQRNFPFMRERVLLQALEHSFDAIDPLDLSYYGLGFEDLYHLVAVLDVDEWLPVSPAPSQEDERLRILRLKEIIERGFIGTRANFAQVSRSSIAVVVGFGPYTERFDFSIHLNGILESLRNQILAELHATITIGVGSVVSSKDRIPMSYRHAQDALAYRFMLGFGQILFIKDFRSDRPEGIRPDYPAMTERELSRCIRTGDDAGIDAAVTQLRQRWGATGTAAGVIRQMAMMLLVGLMRTLSESDVEVGVEWLDTEPITGVLSKRTAEEIYQHLALMAHRCAGIVRSSLLNSNAILVRKAKVFIDAHYQVSDLRLADIAKEVSITPSYLSTIFKRETGINMNDYITNIRMDKALSQLQMTKRKVFEVAVDVGYANQYYFSTAFKKHFGYSPNDVRKKEEK